MLVTKKAQVPKFGRFIEDIKPKKEQSIVSIVTIQSKNV